MLQGIKRMDADVESHSTISAVLRLEDDYVEKDITFQFHQLPKELQEEVRSVSLKVYNFLEEVTNLDKKGVK